MKAKASFLELWVFAQFFDHLFLLTTTSLCCAKFILAFIICRCARTRVCMVEWLCVSLCGSLRCCWLGHTGGSGMCKNSYFVRSELPGEIQWVILASFRDTWVLSVLPCQELPASIGCPSVTLIASQPFRVRKYLPQKSLLGWTVLMESLATDWMWIADVLRAAGMEVLSHLSLSWAVLLFHSWCQLGGIIHFLYPSYADSIPNQYGLEIHWSSWCWEL